MEASTGRPITHRALHRVTVTAAAVGVRAWVLIGFHGGDAQASAGAWITECHPAGQLLVPKLAAALLASGLDPLLQRHYRAVPNPATTKSAGDANLTTLPRMAERFARRTPRRWPVEDKATPALPRSTPGDTS